MHFLAANFFTAFFSGWEWYQYVALVLLIGVIVGYVIYRKRMM